MSFEPIQRFFELSEFQRFFCYRHEECESFENQKKNLYLKHEFLISDLITYFYILIIFNTNRLLVQGLKTE